MPYNHISVTGDCPEEKEILNDISYIEDIFFKSSQLITHSKLTPSKQDVSKNASPEPEKYNDSSSELKSDTVSEVEISIRESDSAQAEEPSSTECSNDQDINAQQVFLRNVGDTINTVFHDSGNRFISKAKRRCFVIYLKDDDGSLIFLVGTQLQEEINAKNLKQGDRIKIEKTRQFKRARDRSHAKSAVFNITKL